MAGDCGWIRGAVGKHPNTDAGRRAPERAAGRGRPSTDRHGFLAFFACGGVGTAGGGCCRTVAPSCDQPHGHGEKPVQLPAGCGRVESKARGRRSLLGQWSKGGHAAFAAHQARQRPARMARLRRGRASQWTEPEILLATGGCWRGRRAIPDRNAHGPPLARTRRNRLAF